ncbi:hypothetical protein [Roseiconus lacunae]|uniref:hypothetical protein n=1 Tax=Roseiconus lacunae TaxID=2605694 RepID=UPI0011F10516|nr:hypothetical protein [Roseiconus lacunae]
MIEKDDPRLTAYLLGELDEASHRDIQHALADDASLRQYVEELRQTIDAVTSAVNLNPGSDVLSDEQLAAIDAASVEAAQLSESGFSPAVTLTDTGSPKRRTVVRLAVAALALYAVGVSWFAFRDMPSVSVADLREIKPRSENSADTAEIKDATVADSRPLASGEAIPTESSELAPMIADAMTEPSANSLVAPLAADLSSADVIAAESDGLAIREKPQGDVALSMQGMSGPDVPAMSRSNVKMRRQMTEHSDATMPVPAIAETESAGIMLKSGRATGAGGMGGATATPATESARVPMPSTTAPAPMTLQAAPSTTAPTISSAFPQREATLAVPPVAPPPPNTPPTATDITAGDNIDDVPFGPTPDPNRRARSAFRDSQPQVDPFGGDPFSGESSGGDNPFGNTASNIPGTSRLDSITPDSEITATNAPFEQDGSAKTWKPATASTNRARLSVGHQDDLLLVARDTYVRIDGFRARVMFDLYFYNDRNSRLEGQFMLRLPEDASLHYVAFGPTNLPAPIKTPRTSRNPKPAQALSPEIDPANQLLTSLREQIQATGSDLARRAINPDYQADSNSVFASVKPARVVPRQKAALAYEETVRRRVDPALVEWAGQGVFQTKVFPLLPSKLHRIVIGYDVSLTDSDGEQEFNLKLPEKDAGGRVEFDIYAAPGASAELSPPMTAFMSGGRAYYRDDNGEPRDYIVRLKGYQSAMLRHQDSNLGTNYFAMQTTANLPGHAAPIKTSQAIVLLDTSYSDRPAVFAKRVALMQEILRQNKDSVKQFAVLTFGVHQTWWQDKFVANDAEQRTALQDFAEQLVLEGATDLAGAIAEAVQPHWLGGSSLDATNLFLLSDAVATWGRIDASSITESLGQSDSPIFGYVVAGAAHDRSMLREIADQSGGAIFEVSDQTDQSSLATAHRSRPWRIERTNAVNAEELLVLGGSESIYPGQSLTVVGRGVPQGPIEITFRRGDETITRTIAPKLTIDSSMAARLYGSIAVDRLESIGGDTEAITVAFARYFRVPGQTCSMVMLENERDYKRFNVNESLQEDALVIASNSIDSILRSHRDAEPLASPRDRFVTWVESLRSASLVNVPTALRLSMARLPDEAFSMRPQPLVCRGIRRDQFAVNHLDELRQADPSFSQLLATADDVLVDHGSDDALKTASTLIEIKPNDPESIRSVAFRAIAWKRPDQAAPLFFRLAKARPYQPQCLLLLARSLADQDHLEEALVCYELVLRGNWNDRWSAIKRIAQEELSSVLLRIKPDSVMAGYANARSRQLGLESISPSPLAITMDWNTDRSDVDLWVTEPNGDRCDHRQNQTPSGGRMWFNITQGLGPELYTQTTAPAGIYRIRADLRSQDRNRTEAPSEALITITETRVGDNPQPGPPAVTRRVISAGDEFQFDRKAR